MHSSTSGFLFIFWKFAGLLYRSWCLWYCCDRTKWSSSEKVCTSWKKCLIMVLGKVQDCCSFYSYSKNFTHALWHKFKDTIFLDKIKSGLYDLNLKDSIDPSTQVQKCFSPDNIQTSPSLNNIIQMLFPQQSFASSAETSTWCY